MRETAIDAIAEFRKVNVDGTLALARQAAEAGVNRFVFISSIKVNGESSSRGRPYRADDVPAPADAYGISKLEAENALKQICRACDMEYVIIRAPLVYGPGVKGNFRSMMKWLIRGVPLPLGDVDNRRSLVALDTLAGLTIRCMTHPAARNQTFLVADGEDLSTTQLLRRMGVALGKPVRLFHAPVWILKLTGKLVFRKDMIARLCDSLQVDISKTRELLGWFPEVTVDQGLKKTAEDFLRETRN